jgi:glycogen debranching enzyme
VLVTEPDGHIRWPSDKGLYFLDTRIISSWTIYANGEPWELLNGGPVSYYAARIFLTNKSILTEDGAIAPRTLGLTISRSISGGLHEDLDITNNSMKPVRFQLEIAFRCDFADIFEVKSGHIVRRGQVTTQWPRRGNGSALPIRTRFSPRQTASVPGARAKLSLLTDASASRSRLARRGLACLLALYAGGWRATFHAPKNRAGQSYKSHHAETMAEWLETAAKLDTTNEASPPTPPSAGGHGRASPADHVGPWFPACCRPPLVRRPFGRDSLIVSLQIF